MRALLLLLMGVVLVFNVVATIRLQQIINQNQKGALERSAEATRDRQEQKDYIKCVLLIRYVVPPEALQTYDGAEEALDQCARNTTTI
jgi:hypothetical protein